MSILITGGAGFIGSSLCERLVNLGQDVICLDNFNNFYNPKIKESNIASLIPKENFTLIRGDILDIEALEKIFMENEIEIIVHLAAMAGVRPSIENPLLYEKVNIEGTLNILECMRKFKLSKLIFASSSSVYGGNKKVPFSETDNVDSPISPYAATKKAGELLCYNYHHLFNFDIFCLRFFTVYGPRQRPEMAIHKFTRQIFSQQNITVYGNGSSSRDYTYINDIISAIVSAISNIKGYEIINLGNSSPIKLINLIRLIENITCIKARIVYEPMKPGDVFATCANITKAKKLLNYIPKTPINEGIEKFISWYINMKKDGKLYE